MTDPPGVTVQSYKVIIILSINSFCEMCCIVSGIVKADNDSYWPKMFATQGTKQDDG